MIITLETSAGSKKADLKKPIPLSIPLVHGRNNPNCYWADDPVFETIVQGEFVGEVAKGGSVNYKKMTITPHGNGTHTECLGHITPEAETINHALLQFHFIAQIITMIPQQLGDDSVLMLEDFKKKKITPGIEAIIIRTLPNDSSKTTNKYSGTNPPYFQPEVVTAMVKSGIKHVLTDLPSLDKEKDNGLLKSHNNFWNIPRNERIESTITELVYISEDIPDGDYLLNLQILNIGLDASPSNPVIYKLY